MEEMGKAALILSQQRGAHSRLVPQELGPLHEESRGLYKMRDKGDRILISSSCIVLSTKKYRHNLKVELFYLV